jgi:hypothetical protein
VPRSSERDHRIDRAIALTVRGALADGTSLTRRQKTCLTRALRQTPGVVRTVVSSKSFMRADRAARVRVFGFLSLCAPVPLGQAAATRFLTTSGWVGEAPELTEDEYRCLGADHYDDASSMIEWKNTNDDDADTRIVNALVSLYSCAPVPVLQRIADRLDIPYESAECLGGELTHYFPLVGEVAALLIREEAAPSASLQGLTDACVRDPVRESW